jgi:hypothetical protein
MLQLAIERQLSESRAQGLAFAEIGGWAVAPEHRCTQEALLLVLGTFALSQVLGGAKGITTATVRHHSSTILRRIGGRSLQVDGIDLPKYYDPRYRCEMEILQFDSRLPGEGFGEWLDQLRVQIPAMPVIPRGYDEVAPWIVADPMLAGLPPVGSASVDATASN